MSETNDRSPLGLEIEAGLRQYVAHLEGGAEVSSYDLDVASLLKPERIRAIRRTVSRSTREFERRFGIPARTMEAYEQGRRVPGPAIRALLRIIEKEPEAALRALSE